MKSSLRESLTARLGELWSDQRRAVIDAAIVAAGALGVYAVAASYDAYEALHSFVEANEAYEVDEMIVAGIVSALGLLVFSIRRFIDLRAEIRKRTAAEAESNRLARHDVLTGLPNRRQFIEAFNERTTGPDAKGAAFAFLVIDLDHFKPVNDLHGHAVGDEALCTVANRLKALVDKRDMVARLGGDEFAILARRRPGADDGIRLARRVVHELARPIAAGPVSVKVGASIGVALYPETGTDFKTLIRQADLAMYGAKTEGRGLYRFFKHEMDDKLRKRIELEREFKAAVANGEIVPYYQTLVDLETGDPLGFEILARWEHPERGTLPPADFIGIAEDSGLIGDMTYALLRRACREALSWPKHLFLSLNLAPRQITDPWLAESLLGILTETDFPPHRLEIEITETALMEKLDQVKGVLRSLRNLGVRVALDDFGTGYSGLYHLRELSLDTLKIDRSFIMEMLSQPEQAKIVEAILGLSKALGLESTAEGIENPEIRDRLNELGCGIGQGFYFGKPQPAEQVLRSLEDAGAAKADVA